MHWWTQMSPHALHPLHTQDCSIHLVLKRVLNNNKSLSRILGWTQVWGINRFLMFMFLVGQVYIKAPGDGARPGFCWSQKEYVMPFAKAELKLAFHGTAGHAGPKELHQLGAGTNYLMLNNDAECKFWAWPRIWRDKRVFHSNGKHILCLDWIFCTLTEYFVLWQNMLCPEWSPVEYFLPISPNLRLPPSSLLKS